MVGQQPPGDRGFAAAVTRYLGGAVALIVATSALFWIIGRLRGPEGPIIAVPTTPPPTTATTTPPAPTPTPTLATATASPTATPTPTSTVTIAPSEISVQILDAAGDGGAAALDVGRRLRQAGYQVVAINQAVRTYQRSTLFYSEGGEAEALAIQRDFPQFTVVQPKPANLSANVDVHVVVGKDYEPGEG